MTPQTKLHDVTSIPAADSVQASQTKTQLRWNYLVFGLKKIFKPLVCLYLHGIVRNRHCVVYMNASFLYSHVHSAAFHTCFSNLYFARLRHTPTLFGRPEHNIHSNPQVLSWQSRVAHAFQFLFYLFFCSYIFVIVRLLKEWFSGHISFSQAMVFYIHSRNCWLLIAKREQVNVFKLYHLMSKIKSPIFGENLPRILILVGYNLQFW